MSAKEARHLDAFIHYGVAAATEALRDCGLEVTDSNRDRIGCVVGSGIGGLPMIEENHSELLKRGPRRVSPFFVPGSIINMIAGHVSIMYGLQGPNLAIVTACTTGLHSIGEAGRLIEYGDADVDGRGRRRSRPFVRWASAGSTRCRRCRRATTIRRPPAARSTGPRRLRPRRRRGRRGAGRVRAREAARRQDLLRAVGFGMSADAFHMTAPNVDGPRRCMMAALRNAGVNADEVDYLNAHGTSTPLGDINETKAIKAAFGDHARTIVVNSTKSMTGHLLGGAGGIESVFTALALHHQVSPPTINIFNQDPECDLDYCANTAREMKIDVAVKNTFGFGGTNGTLVFKRHLSVSKLGRPATFRRERRWLRWRRDCRLVGGSMLLSMRALAWIRAIPAPGRSGGGPCRRGHLWGIRNCAIAVSGPRELRIGADGAPAPRRGRGVPEFNRAEGQARAFSCAVVDNVALRTPSSSGSGRIPFRRKPSGAVYACIRWERAEAAAATDPQGQDVQE